jgi:hypothetical protein
LAPISLPPPPPLPVRSAAAAGSAPLDLSSSTKSRPRLSRSRYELETESEPARLSVLAAATTGQANGNALGGEGSESGATGSAMAVLVGDSGEVDLPYGGIIMAAMRANDRAAVRALIARRDAAIAESKKSRVLGP